jgi:hypothetical protein
MAEVMNTSQSKPEDSMVSAKTEDEDTPDGCDHEKQTRGGIQPVCMEMNYSTPEQNTEASNTTALVDVSPQDTYHVDVVKRVEQSVSDCGKWEPTANSGGGKMIPPHKWADP